ncbi:hypothetical protein CAPTEDRAFT_221478 [Capitella teleta]|uniref:Anosmin-1 n=1 Tax=Capitella teleta TaxID=283909 RepID=R7UM51_CAPTE|nr:hypothetical protein CAPTEDRAFT_221478 [Capitella teleta]|eukprot:ELU04352.1 hypothetical protein CAPTEDRAFT_221478 [Capitella teleta]
MTTDRCVHNRWLPLVWVAMVMLLTSADPVQNRRRDVINAARCRVRCLQNSVHASQNPSTSTQQMHSTSLVNCLQDASCTECIQPCSQPFVSLTLCLGSCKYESESCEESCDFLKRIDVERPGSCPREIATSLDDESCDVVAECESDADCEVADLKCCPRRGCSPVCRRPTHDTFAGMPPVPGVPSVREKSKGGSIELRWDSVQQTNSTSGPVLYIVDSRWNVGQEHSASLMTPWQQIAQTTGLTTTMRDATPGHWYEFRVECVNLSGSRGPSAPTQPFRLLKEPEPPGAPTNLTEGETLIMEGKMAVTVKWMPPHTSHLRVDRYRVFWSKRSMPDSAIEDQGEEFRHVLPGNEHQFQIPSLDADTTYLVQLQAISYYGDYRLKSEKSSIYLTTYPLYSPRSEKRVSGAHHRVGQGHSSISIVAVVHPTPASVTDLAAGQAYFNNGLVKANVSWELPEVSEDEPETDKVILFWSPEVCIAAADSSSEEGLSKLMSASSYEKKFTLYDLRFDCRYKVRVQSVSRQGVTGHVTQTSFQTPSCGDIMVIGDVSPDCPTIVPMVPEEPPELQHKLVISNINNITAVVSWKAPLSDAPLTGYKVIWGFMDEDHLEKTSAFTRVLTKDEVSFSLSELKESSTYQVRVQGRSRVGDGKISSIQFTTPVLRDPPLGPAYKQVTESSAAPSLLATAKPSSPMGAEDPASDLSVQLRSSSWIPLPCWLPWRYAFVTLVFHRCHVLWFSIT